MANTRDIRRRIKSIRNTAQITKAMQMVAASKMRKAQQAALAGRPGAVLMNRVLVSLSERSDPTLHALLDVRPVQKELVVAISTDRGLCGALNTNLMRELGRFDPEKTEFVSVGRKAQQYLARTKRKIAADFVLKDTPTSNETRVIGNFCIEKFITKEVDKVSVVWTHYVNTLTQHPMVATLLPITEFEMEGMLKDKPLSESVSAGAQLQSDYLYEPSVDAVLDEVLPLYVRFEIFNMVLDARASEHSARMVAMKNATENAKQLVKDLTLEYNKVRQASITTELLEICTAQMALG